MTQVIEDPEVFGLTESSITIFYRSAPEAGACAVLIDGEVHARDTLPGPHLHRIEGLEPSRSGRPVRGDEELW